MMMRSRSVTLALSLLCVSTVSGQSWTLTEVGGGVMGSVNCMVVHDDGSGPALYVAGNVFNAGGLFTGRIARWDGTGWSTLGAGLGGIVDDMAVFDDGSGPALFVSGSFISAGGQPAARIAKWDGAGWTPLDGGVGSRPRCMAVFEDASGPGLWVGGDFTQASGQAMEGLARWDGSAWSAVSSPILPPGSGFDALFVFDYGNGPTLFGGGWVSGPFGLPMVFVQQLPSTGPWGLTGSPSITSASTLDGEVRDFCLFDDGAGPALYVGGRFTVGIGSARRGVARWTGGGWTPVADINEGMEVLDLHVHDDGTGPALYAGGSFNALDGVPANNLARWDGSTWSAVAVGTNAPVRALASFDDGAGARLYVGGDFTMAGGQPAQRLARSSLPGAALSLQLTQAGPGAPVFVSHAGLVPAREYFTVFDPTPCPAGLAGPPAFLGLCLFDPEDIACALLQVGLPLGTEPYHFTTVRDQEVAGPFMAPPVILEGVSFSVVGGTLESVSPVVRLSVQ